MSVSVVKKVSLHINGGGQGSRVGLSLADLSGNRLLSALPKDERESLAGLLHPVEHRLSEVVFEAGERLRHVEFPLSGVTSLVTQTLDGQMVEVSTVGNEGMIGLPMALGSGNTENTRAICQVPGASARMSARDFRDWFERSEYLRRVAFGYLQLQIVQSNQSVACNRLHTLEQRFARWLLLSHDRAEKDRFPLTHEFMGTMLGVRRASVTSVAGHLKRDGLIGYRRSFVTIVDRQGLERVACECYGVVVRAQQRLLPPPGEWGRRHTGTGTTGGGAGPTTLHPGRAQGERTVSPAAGLRDRRQD